MGHEGCLGGKQAERGGGSDTAAAVVVATMRRSAQTLACDPSPKQPDDVPSQRWPGQGHTNVNLFRNHCVTCSRNIRGNLTAFNDDTMGGWRWSDSILDTTTSCGGVIAHLIQLSANLHPQGAYVTRGMDGSKWTGTQGQGHTFSYDTLVNLWEQQLACSSQKYLAN